MKKYIAAIILSLLVASPALAWDLDWIENATNETNILVYRKLPTETVFTLLATLPVNSTKYSDPSRVIGTCYQVSARNLIEESLRVEVCAETVKGGITSLTIK